MSDNYNIGAKVKWKWGNGWGRGKVDDRFTEKVTRKIDGNEVTRTKSLPSTAAKWIAQAAIGALNAASPPVADHSA